MSKKSQIVNSFKSASAVKQTLAPVNNADESTSIATSSTPIVTSAASKVNLELATVSFNKENDTLQIVPSNESRQQQQGQQQQGRCQEQPSREQHPPGSSLWQDRQRQGLGQ